MEEQSGAKDERMHWIHMENDKEQEHIRILQINSAKMKLKKKDKLTELHMLEDTFEEDNCNPHMVHQNNQILQLQSKKLRFHQMRILQHLG
jgi:hypothetical protein